MFKICPIFPVESRDELPPMFFIGGNLITNTGANTKFEIAALHFVSLAMTEQSLSLRGACDEAISWIFSLSLLNRQSALGVAAPRHIGIAMTSKV